MQWNPDRRLTRKSAVAEFSASTSISARTIVQPSSRTLWHTGSI